MRSQSDFQTVATTTLGVEEHVLPTHLRLLHTAQNIIPDSTPCLGIMPLGVLHRKHRNDERSWVIRSLPIDRALEDYEPGKTRRIGDGRPKVILTVNLSQGTRTRCG